MRLVVDASIAVEYLLRTKLGQRSDELLTNAILFAPELLDAEVLSVLRQSAAKAQITAKRAAEAISDCAVWGVDRISHPRLLKIAWQLRDRVSAYDALYLAVAQAYDAPLLTADGRLAGSRIPGIAIYHLRH